MAEPESPLRAHLKQVGCLLLTLTVVAAGIAFGLGHAIGVGMKAIVGVFLFGTALATFGIVAAVGLDLIYVACCNLVAWIRRR